VMVSKVLLLIVALCAAYAAAQKPGDIVFLVTAAFSLSAATLFPALVLGIFWKRANGWGALAAMLSGAAIVLYYMACNHPWLRGILGITSPVALWFGVAPLAAGVFGVPFGAAVLVVVSLCTPAPSAAAQNVVNRMRGLVV
jgi:cation/acetate symporter